MRGRKVRTGHNVVVYLDGLMNIEVGVEVFEEGIPPANVLRCSATPAGEVATTAHWGDYAGLPAAHAALRRWCYEAERRIAGPSWVVSGDWDDDPAKRRTDVYFLLVS